MQELNKEIMEHLNRSNLYESEIIDGELKNKEHIHLVIEALGFNVVDILQDIEKLFEITEKHLILRDKHKREKSKSSKYDLNELVKVAEQIQRSKYKTLKHKLLSCGELNDLDDINNPDLIDKLIRKNSLKVVYFQHGKPFNYLLEAIVQYPEIVKEYEIELNKVNLNFNMVKALNSAIIKKDRALYNRVTAIIKREFLKLPMHLDKNHLPSVISGLLRSEIYLNGTHKYFNSDKVFIEHPELYICKAILSKTLNRMEKEL